MRVGLDGFAQPETPHPEDPRRYIGSWDFAKIFCDGVEIKFVTAFDDGALDGSKGWVEFYPSDPNGRLEPPPDPDADHLQVKRLEGAITYTLRKL